MFNFEPPEPSTSDGGGLEEVEGEYGAGVGVQEGKDDSAKLEAKWAGDGALDEATQTCAPAGAERHRQPC